MPDSRKELETRRLDEDEGAGASDSGRNVRGENLFVEWIGADGAEQFADVSRGGNAGQLGAREGEAPREFGAVRRGDLRGQSASRAGEILERAQVAPPERDVACLFHLQAFAIPIAGQ